MMPKSITSSPLTSPLRYPGGKAFLCTYIERFLEINNFHPRLLIEPFVGGGSVALHLLGNQKVDKIALYDKDPLVASFWDTAINDGLWLQNKVSKAKVTLKDWERLHKTNFTDVRANAWKCLFLNRTSFSGIMAPSAGPLGGKKQKSIYKIDCRFSRNSVLSRLKEIWNYRERVEDVAVADWDETIRKYNNNFNEDCLIYLDPPFFHKAEKLYRHYFDGEEHEKLVQKLSKLKVPWILSYDYCDEIVGILKKYRLGYRLIDVRYSSNSKAPEKQKKEILASNLNLPKRSSL